MKRLVVGEGLGSKKDGSTFWSPALVPLVVLLCLDFEVDLFEVSLEVKLPGGLLLGALVTVEDALWFRFGERLRNSCHDQV